MTIAIDVKPLETPREWDRSGLPGWAYHSQALLELEKRELFETHWQVAGHVSDVPEPGDYFAFDIGNDRALVVRGRDGEVRAFHNICRHRGARVVANDRGHCKNAIVCPFHGWVYDFDGSLRGAARPKTFGELDKDEFGLKPMECEIAHGFIFVRSRPGPQPSVAELLMPFAADMAEYRLETLQPTKGFNRAEIPVNWKSVRDVDNEGYHVAMAHPALQDLYGSTYKDIPYPQGLSLSTGTFDPHAGRRWSVRHYVRLSQPQDGMAEDKHRRWVYWGLFPNAVIAATPEMVQFYQEFPASRGKTLFRGGIYRYPPESRQQKLARYLAARIDRETYAEDIQLSVWSNDSMKSSAFEGFHLSDLEYGVRNHHDEMRKLMPVLNLQDAPGEERVPMLNDALLAGR
ncbi:MAG TPA: aromatic ring-hydroxylating dioxygenase subunit alpha [Rhizobiaceae bacterium]|nr:aromatic ring-hydroxylating dioxygenase subunit alpha [Rhizobiaceae bacterium]